MGASGNITTSFPWRRTGPKGQIGNGADLAVQLQRAGRFLVILAERLTEHQVPIRKQYERFGQKVLQFEHPECGLIFELVEDPADTRRPFPSPLVPAAYAIRGFHSWTVSLQAPGDMPAFLNEAWNYSKSGEDGAFTRYEVDGGGSGRIVRLMASARNPPRELDVR